MHVTEASRATMYQLHEFDTSTVQPLSRDPIRCPTDTSDDIRTLRCTTAELR